MELNLSQQTVSVNEVIYDGTVEQPLECDVLLPDYCPDIQKILRCEVVPSLLSCTPSGDRLSIEGMAVAHLYYLDESGCLRHAEYKIPYTKAIELRAPAQNPIVSVGQSVDYFNCRAVSPRRLDMRGAVSLTVKVSVQEEEQVVCGAQGMGMQLCRDCAESIRILPQAIRQMSVREELELGYGKPSVGAVVRCACSAEVTDFKVIAGKIVTKGEVSLKLLYQCAEDSKQLEIMEYALPVSQVIDMDGVDEDCSCSVRYDICSCDVTVKANADGENRVFLVEISANACAVAHRKVVIDTACDCYSTQYECKQVQKQIALLKLIDVVSENCLYKETLDMPPDVSNIIDVWCTPGVPSVKEEDDCVLVTGKLAVCMFVREEDDAIAYYEQTREFSQKITIREAYDAVSFTPTVQSSAATYSLSGHEKLEIRCPIRITGSLYNQTRKKVICDITVDETRKKTRQDNMLFLYYAAEQEPVWEIAKRYNTSVEAIQAGNQLDGGVLSGRQLLLIPMK